jgi:DNA-binding NtrC family response regulator
MTIGRGAENELVLPEPECSRKHCEITYREGRWYIKDYGSRNGTFVNDRPVVGEQPLHSGEVIRIALVKIQFTMVYSGDTASSMNAYTDDRALPETGEAIPQVSGPSDSSYWNPVSREGLPKLLGDSPATTELRDQITRMAALSAPVLIEGPNGVGKGVVAAHIHHASGRTAASLIHWDCNGLSSTTGLAEAGRVNSLTLPPAEGALFLDEVAVLSPTDQTYLLSLLLQVEGKSDDSSIRRPRIMASSSLDLASAVESGRFRRDLYFRLNVLTIRVAPLVDRKQDILPLAEHFRAQYAKQLGRAIEGFSPEAIASLESHSWPGNVRELENTIYRAVALCSTSTIESGDLHLSVKATGERNVVLSPPYQGRSLEDIELAHILATLNETDWNKTRASQILGIERSTLDRKLKRYGLNRPPSSVRRPFREGE